MKRYWRIGREWRVPAARFPEPEPPADPGDTILQENGDDLLQEDGSYLLQEA